MLSRDELLKSADETMKGAHVMLRERKWALAVNQAGHALELMLKARVCVDKNIPGLPESYAEAKAANLQHLFEHDLEKLLCFTKAVSKVKSRCPTEWAVCLRWNGSTKYQPMGSQNRRLATEMIDSANVVFQAMRDDEGMAELVWKVLLNPYIRLMQVEKELSEKYGPFKLFAVCHREDSYEKTADVVVCATWIDHYTRKGAKIVDDKIREVLGEDDKINCISGVITLDESNAVVKGLTEYVAMEHSFNHFSNVVLGEVRLDECTLITSSR